jgi:hypothetical protein
LSVKVGEIPALEKRIVAEANPRNDVASAESHLLYFGEELVNRAVENQFTDRLQRDQLFWPDFSCIKNIEVEIMFTTFF